MREIKTSAVRVGHQTQVPAQGVALAPRAARAALACAVVAALGIFASACTQTQTETPPPQTATEPPPTTAAPSEPAAAAPSAAEPAASSAAAADTDETGEAANDSAKASPAPDKPSSGSKSTTPKPEPKEAPAPAEPAPTPSAPGTKPADPCRATSFKFPQVKAACERGGVKEAKSMMKAAVNKAKASGKDSKCADCHDNTKTYTLKPNAVADLRELFKIK